MEVVSKDRLKTWENVIIQRGEKLESTENVKLEVQNDDEKDIVKIKIIPNEGKPKDKPTHTQSQYTKERAQEK